MADRLLSGSGLAAPIGLLALLAGTAAALNPLLALAAVGAAMLLTLVALKPEALIVVLAAALPWEDALAYPTHTITVVKLLGLLLLAGWLLSASVGRRQIELPSTLLPVALFGMAIGVSLLFSPDPGAGVAKALRYALFIVFFFLIIQLVERRSDVQRLIRVIALSATAAAGWALYQFLVVGNLDRAGGPISDPNDFAYFIGCVLPLVGYLIASDRGRRGVWLACFLLLCGALLATLSRGALVGLAGLAVWAIVTRRVPVTGLVFGGLALVSVAALAFTIWAPLLNDRLDQKGRIAGKNVESRQAFWLAAGEMAAERPLTGVGPDRFSRLAPEYVRNNPIILPYPVVHNSYLEILAENGVFALLAFLAFLGGTWRQLARANKNALASQDVDGRRLATAMQATMVVAILSATFLSEQLTTPFWLIGALAVGVARLEEPGGEPAAARPVALPAPA